MQFDIAGTLLVLGRILLGGLFVFGGIKHFFILPILTEIVSKRGVPCARLALIAASTFQAVVGALLVFGIYVVPAVIGLIGFTLIASVVMLNYWDMQGEAREAAKNNWAVNFGVIGGLILAAAQAL